MFANTTYTYTGNPFTGRAISPYTATDFVSGSFTLITPIGNSSSFDARFNTSNLISYSFSDGVQTITEANSLDGSAFSSSDIVVGTDASGQIVGWGIGIFGVNGEQIITENNQFLFEDEVASSAGQILAAGNPGAWAISSASPVPEPSAFALFASGMLAMMTFARRRLAS